jgi:putative zinc finger/helix-turn-helix YgiT family protein
MRRRRASLSLPVNGEVVVVPASPHLHCSKCGEQVLGFSEAARLQTRAYTIYRARLGLLSAAEIHNLRLRLHLTQEALAGLLRLGANTISRWETGRNVQTAAMDVLLRLVRDVPASLVYLRRTRPPTRRMQRAGA